MENRFSPLVDKGDKKNEEKTLQHEQAHGITNDLDLNNTFQKQQQQQQYSICNQLTEMELIEDGKCRVCHGQNETVEHLVAGCSVLSNSEYLARHNRALMILAVTWAKKYELIGVDTIWYKERWERGMVLENDEQNSSGVSNST